MWNVQTYGEAVRKWEETAAWSIDHEMLMLTSHALNHAAWVGSVYVWLLELNNFVEIQIFLLFLFFPQSCSFLSLRKISIQIWRPITKGLLIAQLWNLREEIKLKNTEVWTRSKTWMPLSYCCVVFNTKSNTKRSVTTFRLNSTFTVWSFFCCLRWAELHVCLWLRFAGHDRRRPGGKPPLFATEGRNRLLPFQLTAAGDHRSPAG